MGGCCCAPSTEPSPAALGLDQTHLLLNSGKDGAAFLISYYYHHATNSHAGTLTLAVLHDGRSVTGTGRDDVDDFTVHGQFVLLAPHSARLYFTKRYVHHSHTVQYAGRCADVAASVEGEWSIGGGWCGAGTWDMRPVTTSGHDTTAALTLTQEHAQAAIGQPAAVHQLCATF